MGTIEIKLTQGQYALIDAEDFPKVGHLTWCASRCSFVKGRFYVLSNERDSTGKYRKVKMHRLISGAKPGQIVDHVNGNRQAQIQINKQKKHLGYFATEIEAARAYDRAASEIDPVFFKLNGVL